MNTWNEWFVDGKNIERTPESEVYKFVSTLEEMFEERPLRLWDLCCGAGRHAVAIASLGHEVYASDSAPNAVRLIREWLDGMNLTAHVEIADMTVCPWPQVTFHGVISWDALYHNTLDNIHKAINEVYARLVPGGLFMGIFMSTKTDSYGLGKEIEPDTFIWNQRFNEKDIPHYFFDEPSIRDLFKNWELVSLAEQVITYVERGDNFLDYNPFPYTKWGLLARKRN